MNTTFVKLGHCAKSQNWMQRTRKGARGDNAGAS